MEVLGANSKVKQTKTYKPNRSTGAPVEEYELVTVCGRGDERTMTCNVCHNVSAEGFPSSLLIDSCFWKVIPGKKLSPCHIREHFISELRANKAPCPGAGAGSEEQIKYGPIVQRLQGRLNAERLEAEREMESPGSEKGSITALVVIEAWAKATAVNGLAFRIFSDPSFREAVTLTAKSGGRFLSPNHNDSLLPGRTQMASKHIPKVAASLYEAATAKFRTVIKKYGCTLESDGWTDVNGRVIQNCIVHTAKGEFFLKAKDVTGEYKDGKWIADFIAECIEEVGPANVTAVCMDGAPANKASFPFVETKYPHVICFICPTHTIDLFIKNACNESVVSVNGVTFQPGPTRFVTAIARVKEVVLFVFAFSKVRAMLKKQAGRMLVKPCETRFGSRLSMCFRFLELIDDLRAVVNSTPYHQWLAQQEESAYERARAVRAIIDDNTLIETLIVSYDTDTHTPFFFSCFSV